MRKILTFGLYIAATLGFANAAVRDGVTVARRGDTPTQARVATTPVKAVSERAATNTVTQSRSAAGTNVVSRSATATANSGKTVSQSRAATTVSNVSRGTSGTPGTSARSATQTVISSRSTTGGVASQSRSAIAPTGRSDVGTTARRASGFASVVRAATDAATATTETRTGAAYEKCKTAYFTCMDQFCRLKNDDYRRCSCSDRVYDLADARDALTAAGEQLIAFTENLDVVGMTAAQATAMRTESEGEAALTSDKSASKALLQAIMNSIKGGDTNVGGKYSELNTINLAFDTSGSFGEMDAGATVAMYNGVNLYNAVYPQCRAAVREDCNDASLQRAITAYLMAVESDCNTVATAVNNKQKETKAKVREGSAMLDLARVENRKNHNSSDITTCLNNVEAAVLSEEVCGANYHKCLDNGEFIDVSTGAPIAGVTNFYELESMLTFDKGVEATDQKLATVRENKPFVTNFENRVKKFAQPALDKCTEQAEFVWSEYLNKALLDIYYAQKSKVEEIKQGCFDFVAACYINGDKALTAAMAEITGDIGLVVQPNKVKLTADMCTDYVASCDNMFGGLDKNGGGIINEYINNRTDTDVIAACRAVAQQCFDKFGGSGYEKFYYPYSGLFTAGSALDWFTLYDETGVKPTDGKPFPYKSQCAQQLAQVEACKDPKTIEKVFGGLDKLLVNNDNNNGCLTDVKKCNTWYGTKRSNNAQTAADAEHSIVSSGDFLDRQLRPGGVATEVYNQVIDILATQCRALQGKFTEMQYLRDNNYDSANYCQATFMPMGGSGDASDSDPKTDYAKLATIYGVPYGEDMCPRDYSKRVDVQSWGACLCWENGGRRSMNGQLVKCQPILPLGGDTVISNSENFPACMKKSENNYTWGTAEVIEYSDWKNDNSETIEKIDSTYQPTGGWCEMTFMSEFDQVCTQVKDYSAPYKLINKYCPKDNGAGVVVEIDTLPKGNDF